MDRVPLPPFQLHEYHKPGYIEHLYLKYNKQYRELGYCYCRFHNDIIKSGKNGSCIKCEIDI